jgi:integrase
LQDVWEIWAGPLPCVPANVYLREQTQLLGWEPTTVETKAYRLIHFFRVLSDAGVSFWVDPVRRGGNLMLAYRVSLQRRVRGAVDMKRGEGGGAPVSVFVDDDAVKRITESRASDIMGELLSMCDFWTQPGETKLVDSKLREERKRPPVFRITVHGKPSRGAQSLTLAEYNQIWDFWLIERRPPRGAKLMTAWWARNLMLWALMCTTGLRRWEVPGVMLRDVRYEADSGWWVHLVDPRDAPGEQDRRDFPGLARFKSGSRMMYVGWEPRFAQAVKIWQTWRPLLIGLTGKPDHRRLLVNGYGPGSGIGSPLTVPGLTAWFATVNEALGPFRGDSVGGGEFFLSTHRIRHSLESILRSRGVPLHHRQAHLGHKRPDTTLDYGTTYRTDYRAHLDSFATHLKEGAR